MNSTLRGANEALKYFRSGGGPRQWRPPSGEAIKSLRKRLSLTQAEFALQFGLDLEAIENWEQERRAPDRAAAVLLSLIDQEPVLLARMINKARKRQPELV